jgi:hypothetical protein
MGNGEGSCLDGILVCFACGERHDHAVAKYLPDGTIVGLHSRAYVLFCEAQFVLRMKKERRRAYLELVEKARGIGGREALQAEIMRWHRVQK